MERLVTKRNGNSGLGLKNVLDISKMVMSAKPQANTSLKEIITSQISQLPSLRKWKLVTHCTSKRGKENGSRNSIASTGGSIEASSN